MRLFAPVFSGLTQAHLFQKCFPKAFFEMTHKSSQTWMRTKEQRE